MSRTSRQRVSMQARCSVHPRPAALARRRPRGEPNAAPPTGSG